MTYQLIAFDMDGTLLTSDQTVAQTTLDAMQEAHELGKIIILATGRSVSEVKQYLKQLPMVDYAILASGAILYQDSTNHIIKSHKIDSIWMSNLVEYISNREIMPIVMVDGQGYMQKCHLETIERYHMETYQELYWDTAVLVDDIVSFIQGHQDRIEKINLYDLDAEARDETTIALTSPVVEIIKSEVSGNEVTAKGVDKGLGLEDLCQLLSLPIEETIAVGDSDNDYTIIKKAGLGVAMGNAKESIKAIADVEVADHDHDGCQEAILDYLLKN